MTDEVQALGPIERQFRALSKVVSEINVFWKENRLLLGRSWM